MSGIHQQHDTVDAKSLSDAILFAAQPVRESVIGQRRLRSFGELLDPRPTTQRLDLNTAIDQAAFAAYGWTDLDPVQRVSAGSIHQLTWPQPCEPKVSL